MPIASLKFTLLPGEFSTRTSRFGSWSPTLMKARDEAWKLLMGATRVVVAARWRKKKFDDIVWDGEGQLWESGWLTVGKTWSVNWGAGRDDGSRLGSLVSASGSHYQVSGPLEAPQILVSRTSTPWLSNTKSFLSLFCFIGSVVYLQQSQENNRVLVCFCFVCPSHLDTFQSAMPRTCSQYWLLNIRLPCTSLVIFSPSFCFLYFFVLITGFVLCLRHFEIFIPVYRFFSPIVQLCVHALQSKFQLCTLHSNPQSGSFFVYPASWPRMYTEAQSLVFLIRAIYTAAAVTVPFLHVQYVTTVLILHIQFVSLFGICK